MIQQSASPKAGRRHELGMKLVVVGSSFGNEGIIPSAKHGCNPLAKATPTTFHARPIQWKACPGKSSLPPASSQ